MTFEIVVIVKKFKNMGWDSGVLLLFVDILPIIVGCYMLESNLSYLKKKEPWTGLQELLQLLWFCII